MKNFIPVCVKGISGYVDDSGTVWLNAENVARGLGFVDYQEKVSARSGRKKYEVIRWSRINSYLAEYNYPPVKAEDFIPENMFYRLAMKANNSAAQKFQAQIADEILPAFSLFFSLYLDKARGSLHDPQNFCPSQYLDIKKAQAADIFSARLEGEKLPRHRSARLFQIL